MPRPIIQTVPEFAQKPDKIRSFSRADMNSILAREIQNRWHGMGCPSVRVWAGADGNELVIRSNLVNGLPPRRASV